MKNLKLEITITDGEKEAKSVINLSEYKLVKELHGVSLVDEIIDTLLEKINKSVNA